MKVNYWKSRDYIWRKRERTGVNHSLEIPQPEWQLSILSAIEIESWTL